jgi:phosphohistidine swiveling domain-containing protein
MVYTKEQVLEIIKKKRWNTQGFNGFPLYLLSAATDSGWLVTEMFERGYTHFFYFFSNGRAYMYYDEEDWENICAAYYRTITTREELEQLIGDYKERYLALVEKTAYDAKSLAELSTADLIRLLDTLCHRLSDACGYAHAIEGITFGSEKRLRALMESRGSFSEQEFGMVVSPTHPSFLSEAQRALWQVKNLSGRERERAIGEFIANFHWIENTYLGARKFTPADVTARALHLVKEPASAIEADLRAQKEEILSRFHLSDEERFIITTVELCFHWQDERKKYILQSIDALEPVVEAVSKRLGIDLTTLKFMTPQEVREDDLGRADFRKELAKRRIKSAYYSIPGRNVIFTNADYDFLARELHVTLSDDSAELKGVVASPGIARGVVRVCESVSDIDKVQVGEVLVASMTRPEYLLAMQKAAAFVTDEGGITSHAAIVAREMKKPCIIGTRVATKVLKDGDLVEVDAEKGVIRKL